MNVTLEQWKALISVVDSGGYEKATEALHKSQSSVTYAVQKLQSQLGVKAFEVKGRKAVLTPTGELLYRRARALLAEAEATERAAKRLSAGWEAEIGLAVDMAFPVWLMIDCLKRFGDESPHTRIELIESVLGGSSEALLKGQAQMAITSRWQCMAVHRDGVPLRRQIQGDFSNEGAQHPIEGVGIDMDRRGQLRRAHLLDDVDGYPQRS